MSAIDDLPPLREVIRQHALSARKSLGQNFLLDLNLTGKIARAAGDLSDSTVIEVGPGPGGLTRALLALGARRVIAVERDPRALGPLDQISRRYPGRLEVICADAQHFDPRPLLGNVKAKIVANLPLMNTIIGPPTNLVKAQTAGAAIACCKPGGDWRSAGSHQERPTGTGHSPSEPTRWIVSASKGDSKTGAFRLAAFSPKLGTDGGNLLCLDISSTMPVPIPVAVPTRRIAPCARRLWTAYSTR